MFHRLEDVSKLDPAFIPLDNTINERPDLREYPFQKKLFHKHKNSDDYWGLVSAKWSEKTHLSGREFSQWILDNPGYDMYHIDPNIHESVCYHNLWVQGERVHEGPMINFAIRLFEKMNMPIDITELSVKPEYSTTTSYHIGNAKFWKEWYLFLDYALVVCSQDEELYNFLYKTIPLHNTVKVPELPFFIFVVERLLTMFLIMNTSNIKIKKFPVDHPCYNSILKERRDLIVNYYNKFNDEYDERRSRIWTYRV